MSRFPPSVVRQGTVFAVVLVAACFASGRVPAERPAVFGRISQWHQNPPSAPGVFGWPTAINTEAPSHDPLIPLGFELPVLNRFLWPPHFRHGDPDDPGRHVGIGGPLVETSWRNRPFHAGWLWGSLSGDSLISERVGQDSGSFGGYRLGWDFDHYWGTEGRLGFAHLGINDAQSPPPRRTARNLFWDVHLLYYPWGDARWRPFLSVGFGTAGFNFTDEQGRTIDDSLYAFPMGGGVKYLFKKWLAVRLSLMDNLAIGAYNLSTMHNVSLTGGVEVRFGGPRTSYFPYHAGKHF